MSKKDYQLLADVVRNLPNDCSRADVANDLADALKRENPRFDLDKWHLACSKGAQ